MLHVSGVTDRLLTLRTRPYRLGETRPNKIHARACTPGPVNVCQGRSGIVQRTDSDLGVPQSTRA